MRSLTYLEVEDRRHAVEFAYSRYMRGFRAHASQRELDRLKNEYFRQRFAYDQIAPRPWR
jgi:hypothetical protein